MNCSYCSVCILFDEFDYECVEYALRALNRVYKCSDVKAMGEELPRIYNKISEDDCPDLASDSMGEDKAWVEFDLSSKVLKLNNMFDNYSSSHCFDEILLMFANKVPVSRDDQETFWEGFGKFSQDNSLNEVRVNLTDELTLFDPNVDVELDGLAASHPFSSVGVDENGERIYREDMISMYAMKLEEMLNYFKFHCDSNCKGSRLVLLERLPDDEYDAEMFIKFITNRFNFTFLTTRDLDL